MRAPPGVCAAHRGHCGPRVGLGFAPPGDVHLPPWHPWPPLSALLSFSALLPDLLYALLSALLCALLSDLLYALLFAMLSALLPALFPALLSAVLPDSGFDGVSFAYVFIDCDALKQTESSGATNGRILAAAFNLK